MTPTGEYESKVFQEHRKVWAEILLGRAKRMVRLVELNAPEIVLENERNLCVKAAAELPIDFDSFMARKATETFIQKSETDFLMAHGYYKDIDDEINKLDKP